MTKNMHRTCVAVLAVSAMLARVSAQSTTQAPVNGQPQGGAPTAAPVTEQGPAKGPEAAPAADPKGKTSAPAVDAKEKILPPAADAKDKTSPASTQKPAGKPANQRASVPPVALPPPPPGYVIGADDVLTIVYWRDKDMSGDVQVRPDGKISLSLINDIDAAGLTPDQLRTKLEEASRQFIEDPNVTVVVKAINSRRVFITGQVAKQGPYPLTGPMTAMQLISLAGGLAEFADSKNIRILRTENGRQMSHKLNYKEVSDGKKLSQNIELRPGDTVIVP